MKNTTIGMRIFFVISICAPLLYFLMYLPVWNGKEFYLTEKNLFPTIIFVIQCLAFIFSSMHVAFFLFRKKRSSIISGISFLLTVLSVIILCFVGYFFVLELYGVPWFPAQR